MVKGVLLFNGLAYPFPVVDAAFAWSKQRGASLVALFLRACGEQSEGYVFPSDLDAAEDLSSTEDAEAANLRVIESNILMLQHHASSEHIDLTTKKLVDPGPDQLLNELADAERIFAAVNIDEMKILTTDKANLKKLLNDNQMPMEWVNE